MKDLQSSILIFFLIASGKFSFFSLAYPFNLPYHPTFMIFSFDDNEREINYTFKNMEKSIEIEIENVPKTSFTAQCQTRTRRSLK